MIDGFKKMRWETRPAISYRGLPKQAKFLMSNLNLNLVENVICTLFEDNCFSKWEMRVNDDASLFSTVCKEDCEFSHEQYQLFEKFSGFVEDQLCECCSKYGVSTKEFYNACSLLTGNEPMVDVFCMLVLASTEFNLYADIMNSDEKRKYYFQIMKSWKVSFLKDRK